MGAADGGLHAAPVGDIAARELDLAQIGQRTQVDGLFRVPVGDTQARAAAQQFLRQMRAEEPAAADEGDEPVFERSLLCHADSIHLLRRAGDICPAHAPSAAVHQDGWRAPAVG